MSIKTKIFIILGFIILAGASAVFLNRGEIINWTRDLRQKIAKPLPEPVTHREFLEYKTEKIEIVAEELEAAEEQNQVQVKDEVAPPNQISESSQITNAINLDVPFTSQAPFEDWDLPYKEACEEASLAMVHYFYQGKDFSKSSAKKEILDLVSFQRRYFGFFEDTTAEQTAEVAREYYGYQNVKVVYDVTIEDIKKEVAQGHPVILPAAGRLLGNIYFRQPGPYYHMLVVKGYTDTYFITNDPGTKRGLNFRYSYETLYNAIHDFDPLNIYQTRRAMIVIYPTHNSN